MTSEIAATSLHGQARQGWVWGAAEQFIQRGLGMLVSLLLARLLAPEAFGLIASVTIFISIAQQIVDGGIAQRVLQKKEVGEREFTALFWCNAVISFLSCAALIFLSGLIARFLGKPEIQSIVVALSCVLFLMNTGRVPQVRLMRELRFRTLARINMASVIVGCVAGLFLAYRGFGVWALLGQQGAVAVSKLALLFRAAPWRPRAFSSWKDVIDLYRFGLPILFSQVCRAAADQMINLLIARNVSMATLGFYDRGRIIPQNIGYSVGIIFQRTNFPILSKLQNDDVAFRATVLQFMNVSFSIYFMLMAGMAVAAEDIILILLGERWLPSAWYLRLNCVAFAIYALFSANGEVLRAKGNVKKFFRLNILCAGLQVVGVLCGMPWGSYGMVLGDVTARGIACLPLIAGVARISHISVRDQLWVLARPALGALIVALTIWSVRTKLGLELIPRFFLSGVVGAVTVWGYWRWSAYGLDS